MKRAEGSLAKLSPSTKGLTHHSPHSTPPAAVLARTGAAKAGSRDRRRLTRNSPARVLRRHHCSRPVRAGGQSPGGPARSFPGAVRPSLAGSCAAFPGPVAQNLGQRTCLLNDREDAFCSTPPCIHGISHP